MGEPTRSQEGSGRSTYVNRPIAFAHRRGGVVLDARDRVADHQDFVGEEVEPACENRIRRTYRQTTQSSWFQHGECNVPGLRWGSFATGGDGGGVEGGGDGGGACGGGKGGGEGAGEGGGCDGNGGEIGGGASGGGGGGGARGLRSEHGSCSGPASVVTKNQLDVVEASVGAVSV